jgi:AbrB family looped-hinge helix DNA binding protein
MLEEPEITTMSEKGQVVIPQDLREYLGIKPKTRLLVFVMEGNIIMRKLDIPDVKKEWRNIFRRMDKKRLKLDENAVSKEIKAHRKEKRKRIAG